MENKNTDNIGTKPDWSASIDFKIKYNNMIVKILRMAANILNCKIPTPNSLNKNDNKKENKGILPISNKDWFKEKYWILPSIRFWAISI
jgi:hypothetical protein